MALISISYHITHINQGEDGGAGRRSGRSRRRAHQTFNYRPISILPVASKIAEKVVTEQLIDFLNSGQALFHPMQFGFRKKPLDQNGYPLFT